MKNAFTLIELLAIMALLAVIILVAVPSLINSNKVSSTNEIKDFNETINTACESYAAVHDTTSSTINVRTLISEGYLSKTLKNPSTNKTIYDENTTVTLTSTEGKITCTYNSKS